MIFWCEFNCQLIKSKLNQNDANMGKCLAFPHPFKTMIRITQGNQKLNYGYYEPLRNQTLVQKKVCNSHFCSVLCLYKFQFSLCIILHIDDNINNGQCFMDFLVTFYKKVQFVNFNAIAQLIRNNEQLFYCNC